jgi:hypothetical protein
MASCVASNGDSWEIYNGSDGWRWRRTASIGRIVGSSTQGYNRSDGMTCNLV